MGDLKIVGEEGASVPGNLLRSPSRSRSLSESRAGRGGGSKVLSESFVS